MVDGARPSTEATWSGGPRQSPLSATASRPGCRCSMTLRVALASHRSANHATHTRTGWCTGFCTGRPHSAASIASRRAGNAGECVHHSLHHSAIRTSRVGGGYHPLFRAAATCCRCTSAAREESNNRIIQTVHSSRLAPQSFLVPAKRSEHTSRMAGPCHMWHSGSNVLSHCAVSGTAQRLIVEIEPGTARDARLPCADTRRSDLPVTRWI